MKNIKVEVEGKELALKNSHGDVVIIPVNKANWVKQKLSEGCHGCIDGLVESLPSMEDYAEDGSIFPSWEEVKSTLNPYNWGVDDYSSEKDFNSAYASARKKGDEEFMYKDKRYNTKYAGTPRQEAGAYTTIKDLNNPIKVFKYPAMSSHNGHISAELNDSTFVDFGPFGNQQTSKKDVSNTYNVYDSDKTKFKNRSNTLPKHTNVSNIDKNKDWIAVSNNCADNVCDAFGIKRSSGIELPSNTLNKIKNKYPTIETTGRNYDDYLELSRVVGTKKADDILKNSENLLGISNSPDLKGEVSKNIIKSIQKSLSEKGYKLPKSTTKERLWEGEYLYKFDGIFGEETKNALLEYQKSLNNKK